MDLADINKIYTWKKAEGKTNIHVVWKIDTQAMKNDFFNTINGKPLDLTK